ncbi:hypothetical protein AAC387_Pa05g1221 [Persea americana]
MMEEINLTMQLGCALDTNEPTGKEVDEESESSIFTSSSSVGIPLDSPGDEGHYRDDEPVTYETVEHFPDTTELDPRRAHVRHVGRTKAESSSGAAGQGVGGKVLMVIMGVMLANKVPCMDSVRIILMTLIGYLLHQHRYFLSNIY